MNEEFDKQLRDHIADVFDNYEGSSADAGWALLREKYPEKDKRRPMAWWWYGVAAGLLLFLGTALWMLNNGPAKTPLAPKILTGVKPAHADKADVKPVQSVPDTTAGETVAKNKGIVSPVVSSATLGQKTKDYTQTEIATNTRIKRKNQAGKKQVQGTENVAVNTQMPPKGTKPNDNDIDPVGPTVPETNKSAIIAVKPIDTAVKAVIIANSKPAATKPEDTLAKQKMAMADNKVKPMQANGKKVTWSIYASAYNNFAQASTAHFNGGGGFSADIRLNNTIKLSTGLGVFQNSYSYNPASGYLYAAAVFAPSNYYTISGYSAGSVTLEMPLRLNFKISGKGNYLSAGFSSALYISETYHQINNYFSTPASGSSTVSIQTAQSQDVETEKHFQTFALAKSFDIAAGFGYPLGKNRMVFEPFLKLPFNSQNNKAITYGTIGVNLKYSFGAGK